MKRVVLADPPWEYARKGLQSCIADKEGRGKYPTMSNAELSNVEVPPADVMLMWVTFPNLLAGIELMGLWGFTYRGIFLQWLKICSTGIVPRTNSGSYSLGCTEALLIGTRPDVVPVPDFETHRIMSYGKLGHSVKPEESYTAVLSFCNRHSLGRPLEMFARCTTREGFDYGVGDQHDIYKGMTPAQVSAHQKTVSVAAVYKPVRSIKRARVFGNRDIVLNQDVPYVSLMVRNATPEIVDRLDILGGMAIHSGIVFECTAQTLIPVVLAVANMPGVKYRALLFYGFDRRDPLINRFFVLGMPETAQISKLRKKASKQGIDMTGVDNWFDLVLERTHEFFGETAFAQLQVVGENEYTITQ